MKLKAHQICGAFALVVVCASTAFGQYDLSWNTIDDGGAMFSTGGVFALGGTIAQPEAGVMSGGAFQLAGGFWAAAAIGPCLLPGDLDGDRDVDLSDLTTLLAHFGLLSGANLAMGDTDGDGDVDLGDLTTLLAHFGANCP
jgi:hypothetical protein